MRLDETLLDLERRMMDPQERQHPGRLAELLDEGFVEHGSSGRVYSRAETLALLPEGPSRSFEVEAFQVRELAPGCALATFRTHCGGVVSLRCSVWIQRDGRWVMAFHQGTRVPG